MARLIEEVIQDSNLLNAILSKNYVDITIHVNDEVMQFNNNDFSSVDDFKQALIDHLLPKKEVIISENE